ncbi:Zinc finger AN1 domain-containing stress-associated protein 17 [Platanthera zijinensis]|uniref:Zinc finger AN1 domain-containing stress-associated protein 17 n=1 Tax=Platanthera zijinensis TaxID=2320716 RepID=A0AAP0AXG8_9ASPA
MIGGTEAFPELGQHCEHDDCNQLDFLPFTCNACRKVFCLEHRTYKAHGCTREDAGSRTVAVCEICLESIEKEGGEDDGATLHRHAKSGTCDASKPRKTRERCPVPRCKEVLTFSNQNTCKACNLKICLKHRFPSDHDCRMTKFTYSRSGLDCRDKKKSLASHPSIKAY